MTPAERLLHAFARLVLKIFFRRVEVVGEERIPLDRPLVFVANHVNGLVDAALLVGSIGLFASIAGIMFATRGIDWYGEEAPQPARLAGDARP